MNIRTGHPTIFEVLEREIRLRNYSRKTFKSYKSCLTNFIRHFAPKHPKEIQPEEIRHYLSHLIEKEKLSPATINQVINALRFMYIELYRMPFIIGEIPRPKKEKKLPAVLSQEEVLRIFHSISNVKHRTLLMLIYSAGLRVSESVRLKVSDIDGQRKMIHLHGRAAAL